jgi:hypothetical protein
MMLIQGRQPTSTPDLFETLIHKVPAMYKIINISMLPRCTCELALKCWTSEMMIMGLYTYLHSGVPEAMWSGGGSHFKRALASQPSFFWAAIFVKTLQYGYPITCGYYGSANFDINFICCTMLNRVRNNVLNICQIFYAVILGEIFAGCFPSKV